MIGGGLFGVANFNCVPELSPVAVRNRVYVGRRGFGVWCRCCLLYIHGWDWRRLDAENVRVLAGAGGCDKHGLVVTRLVRVARLSIVSANRFALAPGFVDPMLAVRVAACGNVAGGLGPGAVSTWTRLAGCRGLAVRPRSQTLSHGVYGKRGGRVMGDVRMCLRGR